MASATRSRSGSRTRTTRTTTSSTRTTAAASTARTPTATVFKRLLYLARAAAPVAARRMGFRSCSTAHRVAHSEQHRWGYSGRHRTPGTRCEGSQEQAKPSAPPIRHLACRRGDGESGFVVREGASHYLRQCAVGVRVVSDETCWQCAHEHQTLSRPFSLSIHVSHLSGRYRRAPARAARGDAMWRGSLS